MSRLPDSALPTVLLYCSLLQRMPHSSEMRVSINEPSPCTVSGAWASLRRADCGSSTRNIQLHVNIKLYIHMYIRVKWIDIYVETKEFQQYPWQHSILTTYIIFKRTESSLSENVAKFPSAFDYFAIFNRLQCLSYTYILHTCTYYLRMHCLSWRNVISIRMWIEQRIITNSRYFRFLRTDPNVFMYERMKKPNMHNYANEIQVALAFTEYMYM